MSQSEKPDASRVSSREWLLSSLFDVEGREHVNLKFCRGASPQISAEDICGQALIAIVHTDLGMVEATPRFGDSDLPVTDVRDLVA